LIEPFHLAKFFYLGKLAVSDFSLGMPICLHQPNHTGVRIIFLLMLQQLGIDIANNKAANKVVRLLVCQRLARDGCQSLRTELYQYVMILIDRQDDSGSSVPAAFR